MRPEPHSLQLETRSLRVEVGNVRVCDALDLSVAAGECWAILGGNGAGKTTLLHTLAGLAPTAAGEVLLAGEPLGRWPRRRLARHLGLLPQDHSDPFPATVLETALIGRHPHLGAWGWEGEKEREIARAALRAVELEGYEGRMIDTLSGGERRRLGVATLLTQAPTFQLLDEPTNHLDLRHQMRLLTLFAEQAREGRAVVMVLHDPALAARFCDHALLLFGAGETRAGTTAELLTTAHLERLYGHPLNQVAGPHGPVWIPG